MASFLNLKKKVKNMSSSYHIKPWARFFEANPGLVSILNSVFKLNDVNFCKFLMSYFSFGCFQTVT